MSILGTPNSDLHLPAPVPGRPQPLKPQRPTKETSRLPARPTPAPARPGSVPDTATSKPASDPATTDVQPDQTAAAQETWEDEQEGGFRAFLRNSPAFMISMLFHMILILVLALLTFAAVEKPKEVSLFAGPNEEVEPLLEDEIPVLDVDVEVEEFSEQFDTSSLDMIDPSSVVVTGDLVQEHMAPDQDVLADVGVIDTGIDKLMQELSSGSGKGTDDGSGFGDLTATFAGTKSSGRRFVFVVDNSNSMGGGKLETAFSELNKAVSGLKPSQSFYVIFYSDTAYGLFHPSTARTMVPATDSNKARLASWLTTVEMCLQTRGEAALQQAVAMRPDVIYLLGDGAFTDKAAEKFVANPAKDIVVHTLGMKLNQKGQQSFAQIAKVHNGTYRDVGVTPEGQAAFNRDGQRPKNNKNGPIWGRALGAGKKK